MKPTFISFLLGTLVIGTSLHAQSLDEPPVKILPSPDKDVLKVMYAFEVDEPLKIKFITKEGVVSLDKIKGGPYPTGLLKRYDVKNINDSDFWIEISSPQMTVVYRVATAQDKKSFTPYLEKVAYNYSEMIVKADH